MPIPKDFTGAVGQFNIEAKIDSDTLKINEGFIYEITLKGTGNIGLFPLPKIKFPNQLEMHKPEKSFEIIRKMLSKNKKITSIICSTEFSALSAIKACNYLNLEIGKDISIITFDGPLVKDLSSPPITAISFPVQELGKRAIKILLKGHSNKKTYSNFQVKSEIIERGSVHQVID